MIKEFLIELRDYLYALKYANILTKEKFNKYKKSLFTTRFYITHYLLLHLNVHSAKI